MAGARSPAEKSSARPKPSHASWVKPSLCRPFPMSRGGAAAIALTPAARCGSCPTAPSAPSRGVPWRDALGTVLPPPAVSGGRSSGPRRRPSPARGPRARARRSGRPSRHASSPPWAWSARCRFGANPRRGRRRRRPAMRRCGRRAPNASRAMGCNQARLSTLPRRL